MDSPPPLDTPPQGEYRPFRRRLTTDLVGLDDMPAQGEVSLGYPNRQIALLVPDISTLLDKVDNYRVETITMCPSILTEGDLASLSVEISADGKEWMVILPQCKLQIVDLLSSECYTFANLNEIHLHGVSPPWKAPCFRRLRVLSIWDCSDGMPKMDLHAFIDMVATWTSLQDLKFGNVLAAVLQDTCHESRYTSRRATLPKLERLTIQDLPEHVCRVLSCLKLPVCTFANITANLRRHDSSVEGRYYFWALRDIVPPPPHALAFLPFFPTSIDVEATDTKVGVTGSVESDKKVELLINTEETSPERARAIFLSGAAHYLSRTLSPDGKAPVNILRFKGPLKMVSQFTWVEIFRAFPQLERLIVLDEGSDGAPAIGLVHALEATDLYRKRRGVCAGLQNLSMCGVVYSEKLLELLRDVLTRRTLRLGAEKLKRLRLEFVLPPKLRAERICLLGRQKLRRAVLTVEVCCRYKHDS